MSSPLVERQLLLAGELILFYGEDSKLASFKRKIHRKKDKKEQTTSWKYWYIIRAYLNNQKQLKTFFSFQALTEF